MPLNTSGAGVGDGDNVALGDVSVKTGGKVGATVFTGAVVAPSTSSRRAVVTDGSASVAAAGPDVVGADVAVTTAGTAFVGDSEQAATARLKREIRKIRVRIVIYGMKAER